MFLKDPPRGQESWIPIDPRFKHAIDLITYIRSTPEFSSDFCIGVAGPFFLSFPDGPLLTACLFGLSVP